MQTSIIQFIISNLDLTKIVQQSSKMLGTSVSIQPILANDVKTFSPAVKSIIDLNSVKQHVKSFLSYNKIIVEKFRAKRLQREKRNKIIAKQNNSSYGFPFAISDVDVLSQPPADEKWPEAEVRPAPTEYVQNIPAGPTQPYAGAIPAGISGQRNVIAPLPPLSSLNFGRAIKKDEGEEIEEEPPIEEISAMGLEETEEDELGPLTEPTVQTQETPRKSSSLFSMKPGEALKHLKEHPGVAVALVFLAVFGLMLFLILFFITPIYYAKEVCKNTVGDLLCEMGISAASYISSTLANLIF